VAPAGWSLARRSGSALKPVIGGIQHCGTKIAIAPQNEDGPQGVSGLILRAVTQMCTLAKR